MQQAGDLRIEIDFKHLESLTSQEFVEKVKHCNRSRHRDFTFYDLKDREQYVSVCFATGHYMEEHDLTCHDDLFYLQFAKDGQTICQDQFSTHFLRRFNPIGITVPD